ncbi:MAG: nuclear transport factor 2 family protein [Myxococcota bacterium]
MPKDRKSLAHEFLNVLGSGDAKATLSLMTCDPSWAFWGIERPGTDGVRSIIAAARSLYKEGSKSWIFEGEYESGDTVIMQATLKATTFKGEAYENQYIFFIHFEGDKVARVQEASDTAYIEEKFAGWSEPR